MKDNFDRDELGVDFEDRVEKFGEYFNEPDQEHKIFTPSESMDRTSKSL